MMYVGHIGYMVSTIGFIVGMLLMNNPVKANKGNSLMVFATIIALLSTVYMYYDFSDAFQWKPLVLIILLIILGSLIGSQFTSVLK